MAMNRFTLISPLSGIHLWNALEFQDLVDWTLWHE